MIKQSELGWLAGIIDGEGSIGISKNYPRKHGKPTQNTPVYAAQVQMVNCNKLLIYTYRNLLEKLGVPRPICKAKLRNEYAGQEYYCNITRLAHVEIILKIMQPHLVAKRKQAAICLLFVRSRLKANHRSNHHGNFKSSYSGKEEKWRNQCRALNMKRVRLERNQRRRLP